MLVVFARFTNDEDLSLGGWPANREVPNYVDTVTGAMPSFLFSNTSDFNTYSTCRSISNFYKTMSNGTFTFLGDALKKNGKPYSIKIDPTGLTASWGAINRRVLEQIDVQVPGFNCTPYDLHENNPNYLKDASVTGPDNILDYVAIIYRYDNNWADSLQPIPGLGSTLGSAGGISTLNTSVILANGYKISTGYTHTGNAGDTLWSRNTFIHEIGHELFNAQGKL